MINNSGMTFTINAAIAANRISTAAKIIAFARLLKASLPVTVGSSEKLSSSGFGIIER